MSIVEETHFKLTIQDESNPEGKYVHRCALPTEATLKLNKLKNKLSNQFPKLKAKLFNIFWIDRDGDQIVIDSDPALAIALAEMAKDEVKKITIKVLGLKPSVTANHIGSGHEGVKCDICEKEVHGFRYKCVVCPNFDLCGLCETQGQHGEHNMIRMAGPETAFPKNFFKRLNKFHERMTANQAETTDKSPETPESLKDRESRKATKDVLRKADRSKSKGQRSSGQAEDEAADPEPVEDMFAQLNTYGTEYMRSLGDMISGALESLDSMVMEEEEGEESPKTHANPNVQTALTELKAMGFATEEEWLVKLLEAKDGDVTKTLEALKAAKKD